MLFSKMSVATRLSLGIGLELILATPLPAMAAGKVKDSVDAEKRLEAAEVIRNPQQDYSVRCVLKDVNKSRVDNREYQTMIKGRDKALIHFKLPTTEVGKQVLMVGNEMWIYMPTTAKPIRISPQQKLAGNAAYGDIARLNFTGNYTPKFIRDDKFAGKDAVVLDLTAIQGRPVTYSKIEYWIEAKTNKPLKAEYETSGGKILKTGFFEAYEPVFGIKRPTVLRLVDKINNNHVTTLNFKDAKAADLPDIMFEKQNLGRN